MRRFFSPNITGFGRWLRAASGVVCIVGGIYVASAHVVWLGLLFIAAGGFTVFEAARGWCLLRACGIKTRF